MSFKEEIVYHKNDLKMDIAERRQKWKDENPNKSPLEDPSYPLGWKSPDKRKSAEQDQKVANNDYYYDKCDSHMDTMMSRCQNLTAGSFKTFFDDFQKIHLENMKEMNDGMGAFMFNMAFGKDSEFPYPIRFMHALHRYTC